MNFQLSGAGVALITPFHADERIDHPALGRMVDFMVDGGMDFIVALGTTAETPALGKQDRLEVLDAIRDRLNGRIPLILGMGGNDTHELIEHVNSFDLSGVQALLSVTPYYNRPSQEGLYRHYARLAESTHLPIVLYNVPARTGCNLMADTSLRLARDFPQIVGTKEASGDFGQICRILHERPDGFLVFSGDDLLSLPFLALGAQGVISVIANAYPQTFSEMVRAGLRGKFLEALALHHQLLPAVQGIFSEGSPAGVKSILAHRGIIEPHLRLPLVGVSDALRAALAQLDEAWQGER